MTPTLLSECVRVDRGYKYNLYQCGYCGKEFEAISGSIRSGNTKSCGCLPRGPKPKPKAEQKAKLNVPALSDAQRLCVRNNLRAFNASRRGRP